MSLIGVRQLARPEFLVELRAIAAIPIPIPGRRPAAARRPGRRR
jgi:hypothetical protein